MGRRRHAERLREHRDRPPSGGAPGGGLQRDQHRAEREPRLHHGKRHGGGRERGRAPRDSRGGLLPIPRNRRLRGAASERRIPLGGAAAHGQKLGATLAQETPPHSYIVHNLNFPSGCADTTEVRRTVPARVVLPGLFSPRDAQGRHRLVFKHGEDRSPELPLTDRAALGAGFVSHSVLDFSKLGSI
jgi:hypothetical protein